MNLPKAIADLVKAQDNFDSVAYANCFTEDAVVHDEGHSYTGKSEIQQWIEKANEKYNTVMQPIDLEETGAIRILTARVSGTFDGSPAVLRYHVELKDGLIQSLKITG
ncbi:nuclear transport factor 2 family protein [Parapedobacter koreensis]|uniref:SnoaL-like domain-containing protein n=1 Tax=Parapedobacter koreensis TaxID=332977 RepID=A0A1H7P7U3_9SPHI|nr:nuclear transport factor 2 family protein [Parapedobacter koreensis]SEL31861.1 hypothetical protein SAMN05421740_104249 [Parapedobacter koreensis]